VYDAPDPREGRVLSYLAALREALDPALGADPAISSSDDFYEVYRFILPGYNARPLEVAGAVGVEQLKKLDRILSIRRYNASLFRSLFEGDERFITQREVTGGSSSWFSFTLILHRTLDVDRRRVMGALKEPGIEYRIITGGCFLRHDVINYFDYDTAGDILKRQHRHDRGFFVGNHPRDLTPQIQRLRDVLDRTRRNPLRLAPQRIPGRLRGVVRGYDHFVLDSTTDGVGERAQASQQQVDLLPRHQNDRRAWSLHWGKYESREKL
jgi:hypothetical protein